MIADTVPDPHTGTAFAEDNADLLETTMLFVFGDSCQLAVTLADRGAGTLALTGIESAGGLIGITLMVGFGMAYPIGSRSASEREHGCTTRS
jgi:glycerol uptake facilitator-like aquaporin